MEVVSSLPGAPALPLGGFVPNDQPIKLLSIDGLGPVKSDIASTPFATGRGEQYQGGSTGKRNIVLTFGLDPNWIDQTIFSLRQQLYRYFMPENWVRLNFFASAIVPDVYIYGVVESLDPNIFSQDPQIQVSILCHKPDFISVTSTILSGTTGLLPVTGEPDASLATVIEYAGTVPSGFEVRIYPNEAHPTFHGNVFVGNEGGLLSRAVRIGAVDINGTRWFKLITVRTSRVIYNVTYTPVNEINLLGKEQKETTWPEFMPGQNHLMILTSTAGLDWSLGYFERYGGL